MGHPEFRWTPLHGRPTCLLEVIVQALWKHRIMLYVVTITTATFVVSLFTLFGVSL